MNIKIHSDIPYIIKSLEVVEEIVPDLKSMGYYYYYPFNNLVPEDKIITQIRADIEEKKFIEKVESVIKEWGKIEKEVLDELRKFISDRKYVTTQELFCILTMYGPYGYFYTPQTVYVNIEQEKDVSFFLGVMLHESLHLILENDEHYLNKTYIEKEKEVDETFISLFGRYFPNYMIQEF